MPRVRVFHWKAEEARALLEMLRKAGYEVDYAGDKANGNFRTLREGPVHAAIIDLTRMPSHGRYVAAAIRISTSTRHIPIVFVDGEPPKVTRIQSEIPDAVYTSRAKLLVALKKVKPVLDPVVPKAMMESYGTRTTGQKLGIKENMRVAVIDPPKGYAKALGLLASGVSLEEDSEEVLPLTLWFIHDAAGYLASLPRMREIAGSSKLWVVWPKAASPKAAKSGVTQTLIRESAIEVGLVDYKICSVDETWSGMLFTRKK